MRGGSRILQRLADVLDRHAAPRRRASLRAARRATFWPLAVWLLPAVLALMPLAGHAAPETLLDLNSATLEQVRALPIPEDIARRIVDYRDYVSYFGSVYDLMEVEGMTPELLETLKPLVSTLPPTEADAAMARLDASYRQVRQFLGEEGSNEGLVDEYLDQLRDPVDVNRLDLFDLMSYQNVSPVDAAAILRARERLGGFTDSRQLRQAEGLRYYAFRNLRDFVTYGGESAQGPTRLARGDYQVRYYDTPPLTAADEDGASANLARQVTGDPFLIQKLRFDLGSDFKAGLLTYRAFGEESWSETTKGFSGVSDKQWGPLYLKRLVLGNYRVAFGQGLIMDNTDFVLYRKTGYGWNVRPLGIRSDLSRSDEWALTGAAAEGRIGRVHGSLFVSTGKKDGILNPDGTVNQYVMMYPKWSQEALDERMTTISDNNFGPPTLLARDAFREDLFGGNFKLLLGGASYLGVTAYEARYNRAFRADPTTLVQVDDLDLLEPRDSEIASGYTSVRINPATGDTTDYKFRRIYGGEFQVVQGNLALQGEYGVLQDPSAPLFHGANHDAFVLNGYAQWDDLHFLAIYRDYDVGFDNPYNRAFCNDARYEQTLLEAPYRLQDGLYSWLATNTAQSKPERGLFLQTRYRLSRTLTITGLEFDQWERNADGMDLARYTLKAEYQPIFNLRLRMRHRYSSRSEQMTTDVRRFSSWESRWELLTLLSNYNSLKFMYSTSNVMFPPRPRLSYPPDAGAGGSGVGLAGIPAHAFQALYEHNLSPRIRLLLSTEMYDGFLWNFEGNEFVVVDGRGFRNWVQIESRVSNRMLWQLKVTRDHNLPHTWLDVRNFGDPYGQEPDSRYVPADWTTFRMQLDYSF